jgi:hypothetical protein
LRNLASVEESDAFLDNLVALTKEGGLLVVALPLPYCAKPWSDEDRGPEERGPAWSEKHGINSEKYPLSRLYIVNVLWR